MIVLYSGRRGSGKTLSMVKDVIKYQNNDYTIYSNMELKGIEYEYMSNADILDIGKSRLYGVVLVVDEIQSLIDSRRGMSKNNLEFGYFIQQIRKRNIILLATAQYTGTVELRFRQHIDIIARPRFDSSLLVCEVTYIDVTVFDELDIFTQPPSVTIVFDARQIFDYYNTNEIITREVVKKK